MLLASLVEWLVLYQLHVDGEIKPLTVRCCNSNVLMGSFFAGQLLQFPSHWSANRT